MGLFSTDKQVYVASAAYNLAGNEEDRFSFLKSIMSRRVLADTGASVSETLQGAYLHGPGLKMRAFYRWAAKPGNYDSIGLMTGNLRSTVNINVEAVSAELDDMLGLSAGSATWVQRAEVGFADYSMWAEQWILNNRPADFDTDWVADIDDVTKVVTIDFADSTSVSFAPPGFDFQAEYLYVYYNVVSENVSEPVVPGALISIGTAAFPVLAPADGWSLFSNVVTPVPLTLNTTVTVTTVKTYSDGRPSETSTVGPTVTPASTSYDTFVKTYKRTVPLGSTGGGSEVQERRETAYLFEDVIVTSTTSTVPVVTTDTVDGGTVTRTTTVTTVTVTEHATPSRSYRIDTQIVTLQDFGPNKLHIYGIGAGNEFFDSLKSGYDDYGQFFPIIPIRLWVQFLSDSYFPTSYLEAKAAYKKLTSGGDLDELIEEIGENPDVGDMDHVYIASGVSLNVLDNSCRKYLYRFFEKLQASQIGGPSLYNLWKAGQEAHEGADPYADWAEWYAAQEDPGSPLFGTPPPSQPVNFDTLAYNEINFQNTGDLITSYHMRLDWIYIADGEGLGLGKPGAKVGELWFEDLGYDDFIVNLFNINTSSFLSKFRNLNKVRLYWQRTAGTYTYLDIVGMSHYNLIYDGKFVRITASDALADTDESGFIVPLHYETLREMSLVDSTQMTLSSSFLVINSYEVVKRRWYEKGFFKILLVIIVVVVVTFVAGPEAGVGAGAGVGATFSVAALTALIINAAVNAVAAMLLMAILEKVLIAVFGEEIGRILTFVVNIVLTIVSFGMNGGFNFSMLMQPEVLLMLTNSVLGAYAYSVNAETMALQQQSLDYAKEAKAEAERIQQAYFNEFGYGGGQIDPFMFVESAKILNESSDTFLTRTLMTGSDIAEMAHQLLNRYPELSLKLPNAFS